MLLYVPVATHGHLPSRNHKNRRKEKPYLVGPNPFRSAHCTISLSTRPNPTSTLVRAKP